MQTATTPTQRKPINVHALRTVCAAVHYQMTRYPLVEIPQYDWHFLTSYLHIPDETVYWLEIKKENMIISTKDFVFWFRHNEDHSKRLVEIVYRERPEY